MPYKRRKYVYARKRKQYKKQYRKTKKWSKRRGKGSKKNQKFSTKGFQLIDNENFNFDRSNSPASLVGNTSAEQWSYRHCPTCTDLATEGWTVLGQLDDYPRYFFGRMVHSLGQIATTSGIMEHFNQVKINWIKVTYTFPLPHLDTFDDDFPPKMFVNYGDIWRTNISSSSTEMLTSDHANSNTAVTETLERNGWKAYDLLTTRKVVIKYKPSLIWHDEYQGTGSSTIDVPTLKKTKWVPTASVGGPGLSWLGPTVLFRGFKPSTQTTTVRNPAYIFDVTPIFKHATINQKVSVSFKDRNKQADD